MTHLSEELQQRMVALIRALDNAGSRSMLFETLNCHIAEARAIAALFPDPDLEAAKDIVASVWKCPPHAVGTESDAVRIALAALKHARTQAKE